MAVAEAARVASAAEVLGTGLLRSDPARQVSADLVGDVLCVVYRMVFADLARQRGVEVAARDALDQLSLRVLRHREIDDGLLADVADEVRCAGPADEDDHAALGRVHESVLSLEPTATGRTGRLLRLRAGGGGRRAAGAFYTPAPLVEHLLDETLEPVFDEVERASTNQTDLLSRLLSVSVCDPACGAGVFLRSAAQRIAQRIARRASGSTGSLQQVLRLVLERCVHGVDRDPAAAELTRISLWLDVVHGTDPLPALKVRVGDALLGFDWPAEFPHVFDRGGFDAVVGNPPFLTQLQRATARTASATKVLAAAGGDAVRPYTDLSALFLHRAPTWVRDGGRVGLVQPQSVLAARDASGVRRAVTEQCALQSLWASDRPVFSAGVLTCAPVLRKGERQGPVRRSHGPGFADVGQRATTSTELSGEWSFLLGAGLGIPEVTLRSEGALGDLAECTADFRDQYYGLGPFVVEAADCSGRRAPLVTSGLIDPAELRWGRAGTRFLKQAWRAPVVDLAAAAADPEVEAWAAARMVPKVLVATQGSVVEAVVDEGGGWLPSVPVITVAAPPERLWHLLAVLLAPPVVARVAAAYAGTALTMRAIKLSAGQVAALPLPADTTAWDLAARSARRAQCDPGRRPEHLARTGELMVKAYGTDPDPVLGWWLERLPRRSVSAP